MPSTRCCGRCGRSAQTSNLHRRRSRGCWPPSPSRNSSARPWPLDARTDYAGRIDARVVRQAMANPLKVALIQNCAERDMAPSIAALEPLIRAAAKDKARFILLPEMAAMLEPNNEQVLAKAKPEADDP